MPARAYTQDEILDIMVYAEEHSDAEVCGKYGVSQATVTRWRNGVGVPAPRPLVQVQEILQRGIDAERTYKLPELCREYNINLDVYYTYKKRHPEWTVLPTVAPPEERGPSREPGPPPQPVPAPTPPSKPKLALVPEPEPSCNIFTSRHIKAIAEDIMQDLPDHLLAEKHNVSLHTVAKIRNGENKLLTPELKEQLALHRDEDRAFDRMVIRGNSTPRRQPPALSIPAAQEKEPMRKKTRRKTTEEDIRRVRELVAKGLNFTEICKETSLSHGTVSRLMRGWVPEDIAHFAAPKSEPKPEPRPERQPAPKQSATPIVYRELISEPKNDTALLRELVVEQMLEITKMRQRLAFYEAQAATIEA